MLAFQFCILRTQWYRSI